MNTPLLFAGIEEKVPDGLADRLVALDLVDHHVHGYFTAALDRAGFESAMIEASPDPVPSFMTSFDSMLGLAVRRWCAPLLGLDRGATADAYWDARRAVSPDDLATTMLGAAGVERWIVDTGIRGAGLAGPAEMAQTSSAGVREILRLETLMEDLLRARTDPASFPDAFRSRLVARSADVVGVKTVAAYRCGFDIDWRPRSDAEAARAFAASDERVVDADLIVFAVRAALDVGLPLQVHVGFGDRDLDLQRTDPLLLLPLLRSVPDVPIVLLHCYPFHRQAGYLAQAFDNVWFDIGLAINFLGPRSVGLVAESFELAPFAKQLYSSDAYGLPELHLLGSVLWRRAVGRVLGRWVREGDCSEVDAARIAHMIGRENSALVYGAASRPS